MPITTQAYPAARAVAPALHDHFARHLERARERALPDLASIPTLETMDALIDAGFWASLRREEGFSPRISLAYLAPAQASQPLLFQRPLPLTAHALARVAPAVERRGIHLGVWQDGGQLRVWGTTRTVPTFCFVLEVAAPGLLVIKHHRGEEQVKYVNVAVLEGDQVKIIDEHASSLPDCPALLSSLLGFATPASWSRPVNVLVQIAVSMRAHGRGGSLLVVPADGDRWRDSIVQPVRYAVQPFSELSALVRHAPDQHDGRGWQDALEDSVNAIAGLTAVDGATVITDTYELLAFGAKIGRVDGLPQVERVMVTEPIRGGQAAIVHPSQLGGTRHLSAAQFVQDQHDAMALVASQDGRFTVFAWSPCDELVHGHRVEALLL